MKRTLFSLGVNALLVTSIASLWLIGFQTQASAQPAGTPEALQRYIEVAEKQNPDVMAARSRWSQADARVGQASSGLWPRVDINGSYTSFTGGRTITIPGIGTFKTATIGVVPWDNNINASWNIFNYSIWAAGRASKAYLGAATSAVDATELSIAYQVSEGYYNYAKSAELVAVRESAVDLATQNLNTTNALYKADKAAKNDVLRAEVAVASAEGDVLVAKNQQNLARTNFNNLLKRDYDAQIDLPPAEALVDAPKNGSELATSSSDAPAVQHTTLAQDLDQAMHDRPELRQLSQSSDAVEGLRAVNFAENIPNLSVFARYGWQEDQLKFSNSDYYFTAGVQLHWNLFSGFDTRAKVAENDAQMEEIEFQKESLINGVRMELQNARLELQNAHDRRSIAIKQLQSAEENQRITKAQYDQGMAPLITMIDAQTTLANAKANLTSTTYDVLLAEAKYRKALGLR